MATTDIRPDQHDAALGHADAEPCRPESLQAQTRSEESSFEQSSCEQAGDDAEAERGPLRRCIVTRERLPKEVMIRCVVGPDRTVIADIGARLPGRGLWLSARRDVLETACAKGAFARAAKGPVAVPAGFLSGLVAALERRLADHVGLARRAGQAVAGFDKAREWLENGRAGLIVQASDGSTEEQERFMGARAGRVPVIRPIDAVQLGAIFGRERAVHVAVMVGRLAEGLLADAGRLAAARGEPTGRTEPDEAHRHDAGRRMEAGRHPGRDGGKSGAPTGLKKRAPRASAGTRQRDQASR